MAAMPLHKDHMMDAYQPSAELLHACALLMDRIQAVGPEAILLKDDLKHVAQWLEKVSARGIPECAKYRVD